MKYSIKEIGNIMSKLYSRLNTELRFSTIKICLKIIKIASIKK
jgi:hypothetical protein